ncbi:MAG: hypothetical protein ACKN9V_00185, partial [Pseudomonadota bacterium]
RSPLTIEVQNKNRLCPNCGSDLQCCKNCHHYDENLTSKCKEPNSEWISDRSSLNSCTFFEFLKTGEIPMDSLEILSEAEKAKKAFRALFR